jgi:signal peptidase II
MPGYSRGIVKARYLYLIALAVVILDQASKWAVVKQLPFGTSVPVVGDFVYFTTVRNPGGAFGLFQSSAALLMLVTIATIVGIAVTVRRRTALPAVAGVALALLLGGAIGNLIDRVRIHSVVDFIDLRVWPVFNIADSAITVGIVVLAYYILFCEGRDSAPAKG